jgi:hypothetical protein
LPSTSHESFDSPHLPPYSYHLFEFRLHHHHDHRHSSLHNILLCHTEEHKAKRSQLLHLLHTILLFIPTTSIHHIRPEVHTPNQCLSFLITFKFQIPKLLSTLSSSRLLLFHSDIKYSCLILNLYIIAFSSSSQLRKLYSFYFLFETSIS